MGSTASKPQSPKTTPAMTNTAVNATLNEKSGSSTNGHAKSAIASTSFKPTAAYADGDDGDSSASLDPSVVDKWDAQLEKVRDRLGWCRRQH